MTVPPSTSPCLVSLHRSALSGTGVCNLKTPACEFKRTSWGFPREFTIAIYSSPHNSHIHPLTAAGIGSARTYRFGCSTEISHHEFARIGLAQPGYDLRRVAGADPAGLSGGPHCRP